MINLLPPQEKIALFFKKRERLVVVLFIMLLSVTVVYSMMLLALKYYILNEVTVENNILDAIESQYKTSDDASYADLIKMYNNDLVKANIFYKNQTYVSGALATIFNFPLPNGMAFTNVLVENPTDREVFKVTLKGDALTRDDLINFKDALSQNKTISKIVFSPSSWVKPVDVAFDVVFEITKK